jgi:hypothetical protein
MSVRLLTTEDLIDDVRSLMGESNDAAIDDLADVLPALNRAQDFAANILARRYEEPLLAFASRTTVSGQASYDFPDDVLEDRLQKLEVARPGGTFEEVKRISYKDATLYRTAGLTARPLYYCIIGRTYELIPAPASGIQLREWFLQDVPALVLPHGRILSVSGASILVDELRNDPATTTDDLKAFMNLVDGKTGRIKGSFQASSLNGDDDLVTTSAVPTRATVLGRTISALSALDAQPDDFICPIGGTCIPVLKKPISNFLTAHAHAALTRTLGGEHEALTQVQKDFEDQLKTSFVNREQMSRVKKTKPARRTLLP